MGDNQMWLLKGNVNFKCVWMFCRRHVLCVLSVFTWCGGNHREAGSGGRGPQQVLLAAKPSSQPRLFIFWDEVLCSLGWPWAQVVEDGLELFFLPPSPVLWLYSYALKICDSINGLHSGSTCSSLMVAVKDWGWCEIRRGSCKWRRVLEWSLLARVGHGWLVYFFLLFVCFWKQFGLDCPGLTVDSGICLSLHPQCWD